MKTILLVDDDRHFRSEVGALLEDEGFEVLAFGTGDEALASASEALPSAALVDGLLPGMDGFKLVSSLRQLPGGASMPVVMISGVFRASQHARRATQEHRLAAYLEKPVGREQIVGVLRQVFGADYPERQWANEAIDPAELPEGHRYLALPEAAPLEGSLAECPVPVIFMRLACEERTGLLFLVNGEARKALSFRKGKVVGVTSNLVDETLGHFLVEQGRITAEQLQATLDEMAATGHRQGDVLFRLNLLQRHELPLVLKQQTERKLLQCFAWVDGEYGFQVTEDLPPASVPIEQGPLTLLREGITRWMPVEFLREVLLPYENYLVGRSLDCAARLSGGFLNRKEQRFLEGLDYRRTVRDVRRQSPFERDVTEGLMLWLAAARAIQFRRPRSMAADATGADADGAEAGAVSSPMPAPGSAGRIPAAPGEVPADVPPNGRVVYEALVQALEDLRRRTYFDLFSVALQDPPAAHRRAYFTLAKKYHPDMVGFPEVESIRQLSEQILAHLAQANEVLSNPERRKEYADSLQGRGSADATQEVARILAAENFFYEAEAAVRRRDWAKAESSIGEAIRLHDREGEYYAMLGWILYNRQGATAEALVQAMEIIRRGLALQEKQERGWFYLGLLQKAQGDWESARASFRRVLEKNPRHTQAAGELRLLDAGERAAAAKEAKKGGGGGGFFSNLFGGGKK